MKITVINGSPKGNNSITLQYVNYLINESPGHEIEIINVGNRINQIERDESLFEEIIQTVLKSDAVIWSFPVYYALIPSQLKRFIELIYERRGVGVFEGRYATSLTTSINFFDHTAHNYMRGISEELGFSYLKGHSAHMRDLFSKKKRTSLLSFFNWFARMTGDKVLSPRKYNVVSYEPISYQPPNLEPKPITLDEKTVLLTDATDDDKNLRAMVDVFSRSFAAEVEIINLHDIDMKRGCTGCCTCGYDNICSQKDGFRGFFEEKVKTADIIIMAGSVKDHYLSATIKRFFDRSFYNGHVPVLKGKRFGYIISGPLSQIQNLREVLEAFGDLWHMKSTGIITDECKSSEEITRHVQSFARELELSIEHNLEMEFGFYEVGGRKIFRDFIYLSSGVFRADSVYYKKAGLFRDLPHKKYRARIKNAGFSLAISFKALRKQIHSRFIQGMVAPHKKLLNKLYPVSEN